MRIRYLFRLKKPVLLEDHWPIPLLGGQLNVISEGRKATALEVVFAGQPTSHSPTIQRDPLAKITTTITERDRLLPFVRMQLESAFAYLQCYFDVQLLADEVEIEYAPESEAEKTQIGVSEMSLGKVDRPLSLTYDFLTRAIFAAEETAGPGFEATLVSAARGASIQERYIDSFRYSFLLIESLYGNGKFKSEQLKDALKSNPTFVTMVTAAMKERVRLRQPRGSDTEKLLSSSPSTVAVIDHLVEKRGFYFHGNIQRKDAWKPHDQANAEALCALALGIAMLISDAAAAPMFEDELSKRHYEDAKRAGAIMTFKVDFKFREPDDTFDRSDSVTINLPGTKVTARMAQYAAQQFLERFEHGAPVAALSSASCTVIATGEKVFDIEFHIVHAGTTS